MITLNYLEEKSPRFWLMALFILVIIITSVDILSGYELSFSLFYLLPVVLSAWFVSKRTGILMSAICALCWIAADIISGHTFTHPAIPLWNTAIRFSVFLIVALLTSALKKTHDHEKINARIDNLTGAANIRYFKELLQIEIGRLLRNNQPFTIVYIDVDNFKYLNDHMGHSTGDQALREIVNLSKNTLKKVDIVSRLGGDEFAFLLPETGSDDARNAVTKIQASLLDEMRSHGWPLTFSIGVLTCSIPPQTIDELIKKADELMYSVKHSGKNSVCYADYVKSE